MLYPCVKCQKQCLSNCIQCKNCKKWTHFSCLAIVSKDVQHMWTRSELNFYCLHCCHDQKKMFDVGLALQRILSFVKSSSLSENSCKSMAFQERLSNLDNCQEFKNYCTATLYPSLLNGVIIPSEKTGIKKWTNNNAESINHAIKKAVDWKKGSLMELVNTLNLLVCDQLKNIERALFGFGDFVLAPQWAHYCVSKNIWEKLTQNQKQTKLKTFLQNGKPSFIKVKCSSDGKLTIRHNNQCGKKPHQRTRAKPNRTRQFKQ